MIFHQQKEQSQHYNRGAETGGAGVSTGMQEQIHGTFYTTPPLTCAVVCMMLYGLFVCHCVNLCVSENSV